MLDEIDWVIAGGESGTHMWEARAQRRRGLVDYLDGAWHPRATRAAWVQDLRDRCVSLDIPFFFKQWGGATPKAAGRVLDEEVWDAFPLATLARASSS